MSVKHVFLVGCPRSGTTWLQLLLAQHPRVATLRETHLFPEYVSPMLRRHRNRDPERAVGVGAIVDDQQFEEMCRRFVSTVLDQALQDKPDADVILEKTPSHLHFAGDILQLYPDAHFIHIVRDPRAVVASLLDAGRSWGQRWAPRDTFAAAEVWTDAIADGMKLRKLTTRWTEVAYETLVRSPASELQRLFDAIDIDADPGLCERAVAACSKDKLRRALADGWNPAHLSTYVGTTVRNAEADGWKNELSRLQVMAVEQQAGDLMREFGYRPVAHRQGRVSLSLELFAAAESWRSGVRRLQRVLRGG